MRPTGIVVVADLACPPCSRVARELPELVRVPVTVHSCREVRLPERYPTLPTSVRRCAAPAVGVVRRDGSVHWWPGLSGAAGLLPVLRPRAAGPAALLLWTVLRPRPRRRTS